MSPRVPRCLPVFPDVSRVPPCLPVSPDVSPCHLMSPRVFLCLSCLLTFPIVSYLPVSPISPCLLSPRGSVLPLSNRLPVSPDVCPCPPMSVRVPRCLSVSPDVSPCLLLSVRGYALSALPLFFHPQLSPLPPSFNCLLLCLFFPFSPCVHPRCLFYL